MKSIRKWRLAALAPALVAVTVQAASVTVITSLPKELTDIYKKAFEQKYPGIQVEMLNRNTKASVAFVKELAPGRRPDVMWASAPDAFDILARERLLEAAPEVRNVAVPPRIGKYPINDPTGLYYGQALSGYGIMWNKRYLEAAKLPKPAEWGDLARPAYFGHVAMSSPARSGTTHLTVEAILQGEGWDAGWAQLLQIAGNCAAITERSFDVPEGVNSGKYGAGLVIDFLGLAGKYGGFPVDVTYPKVTAVVPASIGLIAGAKNQADGKKFIAFALSRNGQELLLDPKISRIPVLPYGDLFDSVPGGYPNIFGIAHRAEVRFDSALAQSRYQLVSALFDQAITFRLKELQEATKAIHDARRKLNANAHPQAEALLRQAQDLAYAPLVSAKVAGNKDSITQFVQLRAVSDSKIKLLEQQWSSDAYGNYVKAAALARQALSLMK